MSAVQAPPKLASEHHDVSAPEQGRGHLRVKGEQIDTSILAQPLRLPFSGRQVMNRFLKAPMTERLCRWNKEGEDIV